MKEGEKQKIKVLQESAEKREKNVQVVAREIAGKMRTNGRKKIIKTQNLILTSQSATHEP
jgi:hypothetical protein